MSASPSDLLNVVQPLLLTAIGFLFGWLMLKMVAGALRAGDPRDGFTEARAYPAPVRSEPPPVIPPKLIIANCSYCGQVSTDFGPCPHCGAPRI